MAVLMLAIGCRHSASCSSATPRCWSPSSMQAIPCCCKQWPYPSRTRGVTHLPISWALNRLHASRYSVSAARRFHAQTALHHSGSIQAIISPIWCISHEELTCQVYTQSSCAGNTCWDHMSCTVVPPHFVQCFSIPIQTLSASS